MGEKTEQLEHTAYFLGHEEKFFDDDSTRKLTGPVRKFNSSHTWSPPRETNKKRKEANNMKEMTAEKLVTTKPELPEVATAGLLMGKRGSVRFEVPSYFNLSKHTEFNPFVDQERSNGVTYLNFSDAVVAGKYMYLRNQAAEDFIKSNRLKF